MDSNKQEKQEDEDWKKEVKMYYAIRAAYEEAAFELERRIVKGILTEIEERINKNNGSNSKE